MTLVAVPALWVAQGSLGWNSGDESTSINMLNAAHNIPWAGAKDGVRRSYSPGADGVVSGVRFRAVDGSPSLYLISLWSPEGSLLSWAATGPVGSDGWRTASFSAPVSVKGGKSYSLVYWASPRDLAAKAVRGKDLAVQWTADNVVGAPAPTKLPVTSSPTVQPTPGPSSPSTSSSPRGSVSVTGAPVADPASPPVLGSFPSAANTGVPAGKTLKPSGGLVITKAGTVVDGLDISGVVEVSASNVTIKNSRIRGKGWWSVQVHPNVSGVVIQDTEIDGQGTSGTSNSMGVMGPATVLRCDIRGVENGITPGSGSLLQDNYVHDLGAPGSPHYDGIQIDGDRSNITIRHNTIINQFGQTAAVMIDNYFGPTTNVTVDNNYLGGGGYTVYSDGQFSGGTISGIRFTNNRLKRGAFGYSSVERNTVVDSGNVDASTSAVVRLN